MMSHSYEVDIIFTRCSRNTSSSRTHEKSRSRIKRLRGLSRPQYRLRVGEIRIFYDVSAESVEVLAIVPKSEAAIWLEQFGKPE